MYTDTTACLTYKATLVRQAITKRNEKFQLTVRYISDSGP